MAVQNTQHHEAGTQNDGTDMFCHHSYFHLHECDTFFGYKSKKKVVAEGRKRAEKRILAFIFDENRYFFAVFDNYL
jgi:hypothetical protein